MSEQVWVALQYNYHETNIVGIAGSGETAKEVAQDAEDQEVTDYNERDKRLWGSEDDLYHHTPLDWDEDKRGLHAKGLWYEYLLVRYEVKP